MAVSAQVVTIDRYEKFFSDTFGRGGREPWAQIMATEGHGMFNTWGRSDRDCRVWHDGRRSCPLKDFGCFSAADQTTRFAIGLVMYELFSLVCTRPPLYLMIKWWCVRTLTS